MDITYMTDDARYICAVAKLPVALLKFEIIGPRRISAMSLSVIIAKLATSKNERLKWRNTAPTLQQLNHTLRRQSIIMINIQGTS